MRNIEKRYGASITIRSLFLQVKFHNGVCKEVLYNFKAKLFCSGVMGSGLLVLSKYPILSSFFHPWSVNGYFHRIQHADWFGGKGVGLCRILVDKHVIHLYNTHVNVIYSLSHIFIYIYIVKWVIIFIKF